MVWPSLESCVLRWARPDERDWRVQRRATEVKKGPEHLACKARLPALGLFVLGKNRLRGGGGGGDLIDVCKCLKGGWKEDGARLFPVVPRASSGGNGH